MEFPHLLQAHAGEPVRHDLPRAFLLFLVSTVEQVFAAQGLTLFDVQQLPTHGGSLRIYARHAEDLYEACWPSGAALKDEEVAATGSTGSRPTPTFTERVNETKRALLRIPDRAEARRQIDRGLRRTRQGQYAAELLRHPAPISSTTPSTGVRTSRASTRRARRYPSCRRTRSRKRGRTICSFCRGTSKRDRRADGYIRSLGRQVDRADSRLSASSSDG